MSKNTDKETKGQHHARERKIRDKTTTEMEVPLNAKQGQSWKQKPDWKSEQNGGQV